MYCLEARKWSGIDTILRMGVATCAETGLGSDFAIVQLTKWMSGISVVDVPLFMSSTTFMHT